MGWPPAPHPGADIGACSACVRSAASTDSYSATRASMTMAALSTDSGDDGEVPMCAVPGGRARGPECGTMRVVIDSGCRPGGTDGYQGQAAAGTPRRWPPRAATRNALAMRTKKLAAESMANQSEDRTFGR